MQVLNEHLLYTVGRSFKLDPFKSSTEKNGKKTLNNLTNKII